MHSQTSFQPATAVSCDRAAELAKTNQILAVRSGLMEVLAEESRLLLQAEEPMPAVLRLMERVGKVARLSRVLFIEDHGAFHRVEVEWCADDVRNHASVGKTHFLNVEVEDFAAPGRRGHSVWKSAEQIDEAGMRALQPLSLRATGYAPVFVEGTYRGVLAFDDCCTARTWDEAHVDALSAAANLIGCAIENRLLRERYAAARELAARERAADLAQANAQLALRDRLLTASAKALEHLMSARDFAAGIYEALRRIGEAAGLSRVQVLLQISLPSGEKAHELIYEWWCEGLTSQREMGYCIFPDAAFQEVVDRLVEGSRWWARLEDWPAGVQPAFRELRVVSTGVVPIFVQQKYVGLVAFDQCLPDREWTEAETDALTIAARGIGAALSQQRIMEQLARERELAAQERAAELVKANRVLRDSVDDLVTKTSTDGILTSLLKQVIDVSGANSGAVLRRVGGTEFEYATIYAAGVIRSSQEILASGTNVEMRTAGRLDPTGHFKSLSGGTALWRQVDDPRLAELLPRSTAYHKSAGNQSIYDFPYKVAGQVCGYLGLAFRERQPPGEVVLETVKALATQVGLALEFRRISEQVERAAVVEERNKFARDLHDTLAQGFAGILMQLGAAGQKAAFPADLEPYLNRIDELARTNLAEARRTVSELRSANRLREPLPARLTELASRLGRSYGNLIRVDLVGTQRVVPAEVEDEIFLIAQESLTNAVKHARATEIKLELTFLESALRLKVRDNGIGFSSQQKNKTGHFGLQTMQERSLRIAASLTIISERGFGTEILVQAVT